MSIAFGTYAGARIDGQQESSQPMRTVTILVSALLIFADLFLDSPLFLQHFLLAGTCATWGFVVIWLATVFNCWLGASHAGGSSIEGLPTLLLLFGVLAATALRFRWKFV